MTTIIPMNSMYYVYAQPVLQPRSLCESQHQQARHVMGHKFARNGSGLAAKEGGASVSEMNDDR